MTTLSVTNDSLNAQEFINTRDIPYTNPDEAYALLKTSFERFLRLVESLEPQDWARPTAWTVKDMLAHQAGGYATGTGYLEMARQYSARPGPGQLPEDAVNERQVKERSGKSPDALIDELRRVGPVAIQKWAYQFRLARMVRIPHPVSGSLSLRHLFWVIHSRDTWMHRLDICRAVNRAFEQTADHDGRIVALVMYDVGRQLAYLDQPILFDLLGIAGGKFLAGHGTPAVTLRMDALDFNILASGRSTFEQARSGMEISGNLPLAERALKNLLVLY